MFRNKLRGDKSGGGSQAPPRVDERSGEHHFRVPSPGVDEMSDEHQLRAPSPGVDEMSGEHQLRVPFKARKGSWCRAQNVCPFIGIRSIFPVLLLLGIFSKFVWF